MTHKEYMKKKTDEAIVKIQEPTMFQSLYSWIFYNKIDTINTPNVQIQNEPEEAIPEQNLAALVDGKNKTLVDIDSKMEELIQEHTQN